MKKRIIIAILISVFCVSYLTGVTPAYIALVILIMITKPLWKLSSNNFYLTTTVFSFIAIMGGLFSFANPNYPKLIENKIIKETRINCDKIKIETESYFKESSILLYAWTRIENDTIIKKTYEIKTDIDEVCVQEKIKKDSIIKQEKLLKKIKLEKLIENSWIKKYIKYEDTYNYETGKYNYFVYKYNTHTSDIELISKNKNINKYEIKLLRKKTKAKWSHNVNRYKGYIKTIDGKKEYINKDPKKKNKLRTILKSKLESKCRTHATILKKLVYTEYDACIKHTKTGFEKIKVSVKCGFVKAELSRKLGSVSSRPNSCRSDATWGWNFKRSAAF